MRKNILRLFANCDRHNQAYRIRNQAALIEKQSPYAHHPTNGDEEAYPNKIASFSKCLPHNELGEVDINAYVALIKALESCNLEDFKVIPIAGTLRLTSSLGGSAFNLVGPDAQSIGINPPHTFSSVELAAEMAELYWMALLRDVPFIDYSISPLVSEAIGLSWEYGDKKN